MLHRKILSNLIEKEYRNLKEEEKNGFKDRESCTNNIFCLTGNWKNDGKNQKIHVIFIDLQKT